MFARSHASNKVNFSSVERGAARWAVILDSPRESQRYHDALVDLLSSDYEQKLLYALGDSVIERMLNVLELESQVNNSKLETKKDQRKAFVLLKRLCRAHAKLPSSYVIEEGIETEGSHANAFGGAADVWKGRYDGKLVAIKSLRICWPQGEMNDDVATGGRRIDPEMRRLKQKFCHEAVIWKRLSHPNLLPFLGVNQKLFPLAMISEWMEHGTILQFVKRNPATNRLKLLHDVASGLDYLHDQPFVHSDIKSGNILIDSNLTACIGDFGLTNITSSASISMALSTPSTGGTCRWMAPELLMSDDACGIPQKSTKESDVYSFAMVAYEIFAHCAPFKHRILEHQVIVDVTAGRRPERPPRREVLGLDDSVWNIVQKCWGSDPQIRPTIKYVRDFLGPVSQKWTPPKSEEIESLDLDPSLEANIDSSSLFTASEGIPEPAETPTGSRADTSDTALPGVDDRYVDFTSYSDGTDSYHPHSGTERCAGSPYGTPQSSDEEESPKSAFPQGTKSLMTWKWVQTQQLESPPEISRRRPGVTFEESPTIHIVPPPPSDTATDTSDEIPFIEVIPPSPSRRADVDLSEDKSPVMHVTPPSPLETSIMLPSGPFQAFIRGSSNNSPSPMMLPTTHAMPPDGAFGPSTIPLPPIPPAQAQLQEADAIARGPKGRRKRKGRVYSVSSSSSSSSSPILKARVRRKTADERLDLNPFDPITYAPRMKTIPLPPITDDVTEQLFLGGHTVPSIFTSQSAVRGSTVASPAFPITFDLI